MQNLEPIKVAVSNNETADLFSKSVIISNKTPTFSIDLTYPCSSRERCTPYELTFVRGKYRFELWGSYGSTANNQPGGAGYIGGSLTFGAKTKLFAYIGRVGTNFNFGNQSYSYLAGASSDIRTEGGDWNSEKGKRSRIFVAGGGGDRGGLNAWNSGMFYGGFAGGLAGFQGGSIDLGPGGIGGNQTTGYAFGESGPESAGGNGYYSGFSGFAVNGVAGGGGGSSFISGYPGCDAVDLNGKHTGSPDHYSNFIFSNPIMLGGKDSIVYPNKNIKTGYIGNSLLRISVIELYLSRFHHINNINPLLTCVIMIMSY